LQGLHPLININQFIELMQVINHLDWRRLEKFILKLAEKEKSLGHYSNETIILETLEGMSFHIKDRIAKKNIALTTGSRCPKCSYGTLEDIEDKEQSIKLARRLQCSYCWFHATIHRD
jgi:hypothetical protein